MILYQLSSLIGIPFFIWIYLVVRKKYFLVYAPYIAKRHIHFFQFSIFVIVFYFILIFLDASRYISDILKDALFWLYLWGWLLALYFLFFSCYKLLFDIVQYLSSLSIDNKKAKQYTIVLLQLNNVKLCRKLFLIIIANYTFLMIFIILRSYFK